MVTPSASSRASSAHVGGFGGPEADVQEGRRRLDVLGRVQRQVEPVRVADDDGPVLVLLRGGRVEAEVSRIELLAALFVPNRPARDG